jgi:hypothetical protein
VRRQGADRANQDLLAKICLLAFGPLLAAANGLAQMVPFNPIFLVSDPQQKLRLLANFLLYFSPFLPGAVFLGLAFLRGRRPSVGSISPISWARAWAGLPSWAPSICCRRSACCWCRSASGS